MQIQLGSFHSLSSAQPSRQHQHLRGREGEMNVYSGPLCWTTRCRAHTAEGHTHSVVLVCRSVVVSPIAYYVVVVLQLGYCDCDCCVHPVTIEASYSFMFISLYVSACSVPRHPVPSGRLTFTDIVFRLSYTEDILLQWDHTTMQEAATLGANLSFGEALHRDLQEIYLKST